MDVTNISPDSSCSNRMLNSFSHGHDRREWCVVVKMIDDDVGAAVRCHEGEEQGMEEHV